MDESDRTKWKRSIITIPATPDNRQARGKEQLYYGQNVLLT